ncbi:MAG: polyketide synthase PksN, partial [Acidobacteriota bacterium]|nr:polyketide synthase PksN [Acidobacteriota bacterium]
MVLAPKVYGTVNLDEATHDENLDFFVLFSSLTAVLGNIGQCDYGYANSFLDHFAHWREGLRAKGQRSGKTLAINWPLWKDGGMKMDKRFEEMLTNVKGIAVMDTETGLRAFEMGLTQSLSQWGLVEGEREKIEKSLKFNEASPQEPAVRHAVPVDSWEQFQKDLLGLVSELLKIPESNIAFDKNMSQFGFDSISFTEMSQKINARYQISVTPDVFFEYSTIGSIAQFLWEKYKEPIAQFYQAAVLASTPSVPCVPSELIEPGEPLSGHRLSSFQVAPGEKQEPIAIIGISGIMPQSEDLETFWKYLEEGKDLVTEITPERWQSLGYRGESVDEPAAIRAQWGGFLKDVDKFDAEFFNISSREAVLMDPQQRIFLEITWQAIEDAGYKASDLAGSHTGLFVGVAGNDYYDVLRDNTDKMDAHVITGIDHSILANRISYTLNLHGPSISINTACSSSLVAIHHAVEALRSGKCQLAIAGGVNILCSRAYYFSLTSSEVLSPDGRSRAFDRGANGYVRGEGAGAFLLKPLNEALKDGDHIYATIRGTAVNHGGRTASLTAPSVNAQAELLIEAFTAAQVDPYTVSYLEAHGTGTELGDPIEINGIKKAFEELYRRSGRAWTGEHRTGIGTVKTSIGHLESAAGAAGVLKVLLSMKHKILPGNIHLKEINPYIQLEGTPFYFVRENIPWENPVDGQYGVIPRRAGVSSFGFGGANAHVVLEEYEDPRHSFGETGPLAQGVQLIVLSARNRDRLIAHARRVADFLKTDSTGINFSDLAYTLQVGREEMEERLAIVAACPDEVIDKLERFCRGEEVLEERAAVQGDRGKLAGLARSWLAGERINWSSLHAGNSGGDGSRARRISLPTYPFERKRYWPQVRQVRETANVYHEAMKISDRSRLILKRKDEGPREESVPVLLNKPQEVVLPTKAMDASIKTKIKEALAGVLYTGVEAISETKTFLDLGLDSILAIELSKKLGEIFGIELKTNVLYSHPTVNQLTRHLEGVIGKSPEPVKSEAFSGLAARGTKEDANSPNYHHSSFIIHHSTQPPRP